MRSIIFLILTVASFWVLYLGLRPEPAPVAPTQHAHTPAATASSGGNTTAAAPNVSFDSASRGYAVYRARGCQTCHGTDATGSRMGPSLADARLHYDRANLAQYLADPNEYIAADERLLELQSRYPRVEMPAYPDLTDEDREALLSFILEPTVR